MSDSADSNDPNSPPGSTPAAGNGAGGNSDPLSLKDQMDYAMKHFQFAADQRIKVLNFYLIVLVASMGATLAMGDKAFNPVNFVLCSMAHILIPTLFLLVERRNRFFVYLAKATIQDIEMQPGWPAHARPFSKEDAESQQAKTPLRRMWAKACTYTFVMRAAFFTQVAIGLLLWGWAVRHISEEPSAGTTAADTAPIPACACPAKSDQPLLFRLREESIKNDSKVTTKIEVMKEAARPTSSQPDHP